MFGDHDDQLEFDKTGEEAYFIEYDMNNLEDDDCFYPQQAKSVDYVENFEALHNHIDDVEDQDMVYTGVQTGDMICEEINEENVQTDFDYEPRPKKQVPNR